MERKDHILGCILGTAVGDAIGLPREGISRRRAERMFGIAPLGHRFVFGRGMCSDDTEHTLMVGLALLASDGDPDRFAIAFARRLRWWFLRIPAGIGLGTLKACLKLWMGVSPFRSGVSSAGNGPAMRSALIGVMASSDEHLNRLVVASTAVTHSDPRAEQGAGVIARLARWVTQPIEQRPGLEQVVLDGVEDTQLRENLELAMRSANKSATPDEFASELKQSNGISGFVNHTVPAAVYCWLANRDSYRDAVETAVCLGGDSDTVAAITGAIAGAELGRDAIPKDWLSGLHEWPCGVEWMVSLAEAIEKKRSGGDPQMPKFYASVALIRNVYFTAIVLLHGFRRLMPPY